MKKIFILGCLFIGLSFLQADKNDLIISQLDNITNDTRGMDVDDLECKKSIIEYHKLLGPKANDGLQKEYEDCMAKKIRKHEREKEIEDALWEKEHPGETREDVKPVPKAGDLIIDFNSTNENKHDAGLKPIGYRLGV